MNFEDDMLLEQINNRLSNPNMTIGARWFHDMSIDFTFTRNHDPNIIPHNLITDLINTQIATNEDGSFTNKVNAAYNDWDEPVDWPMVLLTPNESRTIQNQEPIVTYLDTFWEFNYLHSVDLFENENPDFLDMNDLLDFGLDHLDELFSGADLERLRSSWRGRMASLAARACRLILPPVETMVNLSAFKLTNNNCLSRNWWLTKFNEAEDGNVEDISIKLQNNRTIDLRRDERGYVNLKY